jgi:2-C-methyl-D-erythritol 2,4-cyclodiphosphate synthase
MFTKTGIGLDAHRFCENRPLVLGGVKLDCDRGLLGHSDADVLCHAVMDALLGAVAEGDIGSHFPDTDPEWEGACSLELLARVAEIMGRAGAEIINIDATVMAERPKLAPYIPQMRQNMAERLGLDCSCVSVKATTLEQMGAIGREEGIAVLAVATVRQ